MLYKMNGNEMKFNETLSMFLNDFYLRRRFANFA